MGIFLKKRAKSLVAGVVKHRVAATVSNAVLETIDHCATGTICKLPSCAKQDARQLCFA